MDDLIAGYRRFRNGAWVHERERWAELTEGQAPRTMIVACSDSRVDPAQIFDTRPGEVFVVRNVAALVPPFETSPGQHGVSAALEFAVRELKVAEIVVMGHGRCGGCHAALTDAFSEAEPGKGGFIASWTSLLDDARDRVRSRFDDLSSRDAGRAMEEEAVKTSLANLRTFPFVRDGEMAGTLTLTGAVFAIADGVLSVLGEDGEFAPV